MFWLVFWNKGQGVGASGLIWYTGSLPLIWLKLG